MIARALMAWCALSVPLAFAVAWVLGELDKREVEDNDYSIGIRRFI